MTKNLSDKTQRLHHELESKVVHYYKESFKDMIQNLDFSKAIDLVTDMVLLDEFFREDKVCK